MSSEQSNNFYKDNADLRWYAERGIDWSEIVRLTERDFADKDDEGHGSLEEALEFYGEIANMLGELTAKRIAPFAHEIDRQEIELKDDEVIFPPRLETLFREIKDLDLHGLCVPRELGGMNAPMLVYFIGCELIARAEVSVMSHHGFHGGMAMAALIFSLTEGSSEVDPITGRVKETRFRKMIEEIIAGEAWGAMDITEPNAGSDMAALRSVGEQDEEGNWFVSGEKIFITSGQAKYHFVIARTEERGDADDPLAGLGGLSMFLVERDDANERVQLTRLEEKVGHHGSATCGLVYDRAPAQLIGKRGEGFRYMLVLMNNARLGVGFESLGLCEAAYRMAKRYTSERPSMGKTVDRHEMIADYLDEMEADIVGIRALAMNGAVHEELAQKYKLALDHYGVNGSDRSRYQRRLRKHKAMARRITPLLKYFSAEKAVEHGRRAIQLHGGNGYTTEYGAEKLLRDALVMPIYEGTSQIQSLMAMKDTLGNIMKNPQRFVKESAQANWRSLSSRDPLERRVAKLQTISYATQQHLIMRTAGDKMKGLRDVKVSAWTERFFKNWDPKRDFAFAMLHAERLTKILTDVLVAELLFEQQEQDPARRPLLERHLERAEVRCRFWHDEITTTGERILRRLERLNNAHEEAAE